MVDQLKNFAQSYVRAAKEQGYSDEKILMTVRAILEEQKAKQEVNAQFLYDSAKMERYVTDVYNLSIKKRQYCPNVYRMEIPLQVMFIIHEKKYLDYLEFRRLVSVNCKVEPPHVDRFVCGKNISSGIEFLLCNFASAKRSEWYRTSFQGRLSILESIEEKISKEIQDAMESS